MMSRVFIDIDRIVVDGPPLSANEQAELTTAIRSHLNELVTGGPDRRTAVERSPRASRTTMIGRDVAASIARQLPWPAVAPPASTRPEPRTGEVR